MRSHVLRSALGAALVLSAVGVWGKQQAKPAPGAAAIDRTVLPIAEPDYPRATELDARNAKAPPRFEVKAPKGAPNVIIFLIDDIGFGHASTFGGGIPMPTLDRLASQGLKYNRFHTTALCSPTRVALLTGRNHHTNNAGAIMEVATAFPGNTGARPQSVTPLAEILRQNGYSTAAFGKYHETAPWEVSVSGPFDRWPTHSGFDKFYGFIGGETNQWAPLVYDGTIKVELPHDPNYHFTTDMTNQAIAVDPEPAVADAGQAVLHLLRHRRHARAASRAEGLDREVQGQVRRRLGQVPRGDLRPAEADGHHPAGRQARAQARRHQGLGQADGRREEAVRAPDGSVRGIRRAHRPRDRPRGEGDRRPRRARQHADPLRGGRQRRQRRRRHGRHVQRDDVLQRRRGDGARHAQEHRQVGRARDLPAHGGGLGGGRQHALHVDQAGGLQLRRHAQSARDQLARAHQGQGRDPQPVPARDRHRADRARGGGHSGAEDGQRRGADADGRRQHGLHLRRCEGRGPAQDAVLRDLRQPRHLQRRLGGRHRAQGAVGSGAAAQARRGRLGALQRGRGLQRDQRPGRQQSGQAQGAAGALHEGSRALPRAADRRPVARAVRSRRWRAVRT